MKKSSRYELKATDKIIVWYINRPAKLMLIIQLNNINYRRTIKKRRGSM